MTGFDIQATVALALGWLLDVLVGDPRWLPHPVVAMGRWISFWEKRLNRGACRKVKGALLVTLSLVLCYLLVAGCLWALASVPLSWGHVTSPACVLLSAVLIFYCLAGHTLRREVRLTFLALERSLSEGRTQVGRIVGRDVSNLSPQEVRTAALETLAENLSDGVVAPLFWLCLLGVPGMVTYKLVNTFDSMIGYRNERYRDFGCTAARIDDVANFIPARITALLVLAVGRVWLMVKDARPHQRSRHGLLPFLFRYGSQHASPNSGWPEAALAAILDCRFGGAHNYFGESVYKPYIGSNPRTLTTDDMHVSIRICFAAELVAVALSLVIVGL